METMLTMNTAMPDPVAARTRARLLIHADAAPERRSGWWVVDAMHRLRKRIFGRTEATPALRLRVDDAQGRHMFALDDAGAVTRVELDPGTYQVTATRGTLRRVYTMRLVHGGALQLLVRFASEQV
jgi:hypothetical protein